MNYADAFLRTYYSGRPCLTELILEHRRVMLELEEAEARMAQTVVKHDGEWVPVPFTSEIGPVAPPSELVPVTVEFGPCTPPCEPVASTFERVKAAMRGGRGVSTKCAECGLDGNHDIWCPHWQPYVADES